VTSETDRNEAETPFEVEVHLANGNVIRYHVPEDRVDEIVSRPSWDWPTGISEEQKRFAAVWSDVANGVQKGTGFLQGADRDGRRWLIRANAIVAFSVKDYREPAAPHPIGYRLPIPEKGESSASGT
jgi:hypothetical protein